MIPVVEKDLCTGCGRCLEVCPPRAIYLEGERAKIEEDFCEECGLCASHCPQGAITIPWPHYVPHSERIVP